MNMILRKLSVVVLTATSLTAIAFGVRFFSPTPEDSAVQSSEESSLSTETPLNEVQDSLATISPTIEEPLPTDNTTSSTASTDTETATPTPQPAISNPKPTPTPTPTPTPKPTPTPTPAPAPATEALVRMYTSGTYTATGRYSSPEGGEKITITLVVKDDVIASASGKNLATDGTSKRYQQRFLDNFAPLVVGKKLSDVRLSKVSGASLTPKGFNDAVAQIRTQAQV